MKTLESWESSHGKGKCRMNRSPLVPSYRKHSSGQAARVTLVDSITGKRRDGLIAFCSSRLGGAQINYASWNLERELREVLHLILSSPEYELS